MKIRKTVRALILDSEARVLLIKHRDVRKDGTEHIFWAAPGGGVEDGEDDNQALARELYEEIGISAPVEPLAVWRRQLLHSLRGPTLLFDETYYLIKSDAKITFRNACTEDEIESLKELKWFGETDIKARPEPIMPEDFVALISPILRGVLPETPVLLGLLA